MMTHDLSAASSHFTQGLTLLDDTDLPAIAYGCHYGLGHVSRLRGNLADALTHYRRSVEAVERLQSHIGAEDYKIAFRSDKLQIYEDLTLLNLDLNTAAAEREAFETMERAKARALLDTLVSEKTAASLSAECQTCAGSAAGSAT